MVLKIPSLILNHKFDVRCCLIAVEDPSENFQRVRDFLDVKNCANLKSFKRDKLHEGFSYDMELEAREKLKINKVN